MSRKASRAISSRIFWSVSLLFFVSGGTGLAYQVIWFKRFSHVWGSTSLAFAAVGGSFLFGLGLGAYLFGRLADTVKVPLRWYGLCELLIGLLALVIPYEIAFLVDASVGLYAGIPQQPALRFLAQFCITLLVIGPPCVLMGGTLPQLIRQLTTRDGSLDQATGWLYAINTFGAAVGCYLTGFHLLPALGLLWTNNLTAAVNISIGAFSILLSRTVATPAEGRARPAVGTETTSTRWNLAMVGLCLATILSGCAALMLEMTWTRQLSVMLGGSTYALTATLFVVLVGIALGSLLFHGFLRRIASRPLLPLVAIGVLIAGALVGNMAIPSLSRGMGLPDVRAYRGTPLGNALTCVGASAALEFIPALVMGVLFPLLIHLTRASAERVGAAVGNIYAWNTLGSILGASLTSLLLFPWIGTHGATALAVGFYLVSALLVVPWRGTVNLAMLSTAAVAGVAAVVAIARPIDPRLTNMGFYMYGDPATELAAKKQNVDWVAAITPVFFREGASSNVFVSRVRNDVNLRVNGKVDASSATDMVTQLGLAYFPRIFKHDAKEVLVIGFGSGCTSGRCLIFPDTRVTCCEIEPAVYEAADQFSAINHSPQKITREWLEAQNSELPPEKQQSAEEIAKTARFSIMFADGRTAIQSSDKRYDIIISEPSNPWLAGVSNLFTREFFRAAREHLTDDGVLAQWIQTYNFTISDYLMIVRTLKSEFPHFGAIALVGGTDTVLLASNKPLLPTSRDLATLQKVIDAIPEIKDDFQTWFGGADLRWVLLQQYSLGQDQLARLVAEDRSSEINTDLHLRLEFDAPLRLFSQLSPDESATAVLNRSASPAWRRRLAQTMALEIDSAESLATAGQYLLNQFVHPLLSQALVSAGRLDEAATLFEKAIEEVPTLVAAHRGLAGVRRLQKRVDDAIAELETVLRLAPEDAAAHAELATDYLSLKDARSAVAHYRLALRLHPRLSVTEDNYKWANNLAWLLATEPDANLRDGTEAMHWVQQVCQLQHFQEPEALDTLAVAHAELGQFGEAIEVSQQAIKLAAGNPRFIKSVENRIKLYESSQPFRQP